MLNSLLKKELIETLYNIRNSSMFGDGLESDYIMDGVHIVGLNNMTDQELITEYEDSVGDDDDEFLIKLKAEIESYKMLSV